MPVEKVNFVRIARVDRRPQEGNEMSGEQPREPVLMEPVYECWNDEEAAIVISVLGAYGIEARANSEIPHSVLPITADGLGRVEVLVDAKRLQEAKKVLADRETAGRLADGEEVAGDES